MLVGVGKTMPIFCKNVYLIYFKSNGMKNEKVIKYKFSSIEEKKYYIVF